MGIRIREKAKPVIAFERFIGVVAMLAVMLIIAGLALSMLVLMATGIYEAFSTSKLACDAFGMCAGALCK